MPRGSEVTGPPPSPTPQAEDGEPAVHLNRADTMILSHARECQFDAINDLFKAVESSKYISTFADSIASTTVKDLLETQSSSVHKLYKFVRSKNFQGKNWSQIAMSWPPIIPDNPQVIDLYYLLIRIIDQLTTPRKFFQWFVKGLFPTIWNIKRQSCNNPIISAISKCTVEGKPGNDYWAILKKENIFILINMEGGQRNVILESPITDISEINSGIAVSKKGRVLATFYPASDALSKKWLTVLTKDVVYNAWLNCGEGPYPAEFVVSLYHAMMVSDMYLTRALIASNDTKGTDFQEMLMDIYSYGCRVTMLFQTVLICEFEKTNFSFSAFLEPKNSFIKMIDVILHRNGKKYVDVIVKKAADYINKRLKETDIRNEMIDANAGEIPFFTVLKLIYNSANYLPPEIRHILSIICSYSIIRVNDRSKVFKIFSTVIGDRFIVKELKSKIKNKEIREAFIPILKKALSFTLLDHPYEEWNTRLRRHTFPALENFYMESARFKGEFNFEAPPREKVMEDLVAILDSLQKPTHWSKFMKAFEQIAGTAVATGSILSWNFSVALSMGYDLMSDSAMLEEAAEKARMCEDDTEVIAENNEAGKFDTIEKDVRLMDVLRNPPAEKATIEKIDDGALPPLFTMAYPGDFPVYIKGAEVKAATSDEPIPYVMKKVETKKKKDEIPNIIDQPPPIPSIPGSPHGKSVEAVAKPPPIPEIPTDIQLSAAPNGLMINPQDSMPASPRSSRRSAKRSSSVHSLTELTSEEGSTSEGKKKRRRRVSKKSSSTNETSDDQSSEETSKKSPKPKTKKKVVRKKSKSK